MKIKKIWMGAILCSVVVGTMSPLAFTLTSCSHGKETHVNYRTVHELEQKPMLVESAQDAFAEWTKLSTNEKTIDLFSGIFDGFFGKLQTSDEEANNDNAVSTTRTSATDTIIGIIIDLLKMLGINVGDVDGLYGLGEEDATYIIENKLDFDISSSSFKNTKLNDVECNIPGTRKMDINTNLWSGKVKMMLYGGFAGIDLSGITFIVNNLPITSFDDKMNFGIAPYGYSLSDFSVVFGENSIFTKAGTQLSLVIPSSLSSNIDLILSIASIFDWEFPGDIKSMYNRPIPLPTAILGALFGNGLMTSAGPIMYSYIYDYVSPTRLQLDKLNIVKTDDVSADLPDGAYVSGRSFVNERYQLEALFDNDAPANRFIDFSKEGFFTEDGTDITSSSNDFINISSDGLLSLHSDGYISSIFGNAYTTDKVMFNADIKLTPKNQIVGFDENTLSQDVCVKLPFDYFNVNRKNLGPSSNIQSNVNLFNASGDTTLSYAAGLPCSAGLSSIDIAFETISNSQNFWKDMATNDTWNARDIFNSGGFVIVDEHSTYQSMSGSQMYPINYDPTKLTVAISYNGLTTATLNNAFRFQPRSIGDRSFGFDIIYNGGLAATNYNQYPILFSISYISGAIDRVTSDPVMKNHLNLGIKLT